MNLHEMFDLKLRKEAACLNRAMQDTSHDARFSSAALESRDQRHRPHLARWGRN